MGREKPPFFLQFKITQIGMERWLGGYEDPCSRREPDFDSLARISGGSQLPVNLALEDSTSLASKCTPAHAYTHTHVNGKNNKNLKKILCQIIFLFCFA